MAFTTLSVLSVYLFCVVALISSPFNGLLAYRGTGRLDKATVWAYRGSGRFAGLTGAELTLSALLGFYRGSERDLQAA